jgi:hypothetical protein
MSRIVLIAGDIGCSAIILDALNAALVKHYKRFGFITLPRNQLPQKMFLPMATLWTATAA